MRFHFWFLKKYVPGITHHQLCTVANLNPQLSKDFLLSMGHSPQKHEKKSQSFKGVMLPPICLIPPVPRCTLCKGYQSSSIQGTEVLSYKRYSMTQQISIGTLRWHLLHAIMDPKQKRQATF